MLDAKLLKCKRRQHTGPVNFGTFEKRTPDQLDTQGASQFHVGQGEKFAKADKTSKLP